MIDLVKRNKSGHLDWGCPTIGFETKRSLLKSNIKRSYKPEESLGRGNRQHELWVHKGIEKQWCKVNLSASEFSWNVT